MPASKLVQALGHAQLRPSLLAAAWVLGLFVAGVLVAREHAEPLRALMAGHEAVALAVFVGSTVLAVLLPLASNLPLVPLAVLAWGPAWTAALLLGGWVMGASLSFWLARRARAAVMRRFPSVLRHADIDRLVHPRHRFLSLVLLRMTFPVDLLSYALGLFSQRTTLGEVFLSTVLGAAPFALLLAWVPALPLAWQLGVLVSSTLAFVLYVPWALGAQQADAPRDVSGA